MGLSASAVVGAGLAALLLSGCGSGGPATSAPRSAAAVPARPDTAETVSISIVVPANGATLTLARGRRTGTLDVAGFAASGSRVRVTADCRPTRCARRVAAGDDGAWKVRLAVRTAVGQRRLTISAGAADPASPAAGNSVLVLVTGRAGRPRVRTPKPAKPAPAPSRPTAPPPATSAATLSTPSPQAVRVPDGGSRATRVYLVGDSLAEGIATLLPAALPGRSVTVDARISRPLADGMRLARAAPKGTILAVSLFTNDDPRGVSRLAAAVRESVRIAGPTACAVWATIVRPPVGGVPYAAANARLEALAADPALAGHLRIVPWARSVAAHPGWLTGDGVHATPAGYRARATLYAQAIDRC